MKKLLISLAIGMLCSIAVSAQDIITRRDGRDIEAVVEEIGRDYVKYKLFDEPDGVTYVDQKSDLFRIKYENGRIEVFEQQPRNEYDGYYEFAPQSVEFRRPMKYKELKVLFNPKDYIPMAGDPYSPGWAGVASFFFPGFGESLCNEWNRGYGKFLGSFGLLALGNILVYSGVDIEGGVNTGNSVAALFCVAGAFAIDIWSVVDAVKIAKVKNMYDQDLRRKYGIQLHLSPSINYAPTPEGTLPAVGMTLALNF